MEIIEAYKTFDGKMFETAEKAKEHEYNYMATQLEKIILHNVTLCKAKDKITLMDNIYKNREFIFQTLSKLVWE